jgi:hypothetical protein
MDNGTGSAWFRMGRVGSLPLTELLRDDRCDELSVALDDYPPYLLCVEKSGPSKGTLLQLAVLNGQSKAVLVILGKLKKHFLDARVGETSTEIGTPQDFIDTAGATVTPRLINEDPARIGSLAALVTSLSDPVQRRAVASALLGSAESILDRDDLIQIGLASDDPDVVSQITDEDQADWLIEALELGAVDCAEALFEKCIAMEQDDLAHCSLIHRAADLDCDVAILTLVQRGEDPDVRDSYGATPLHYAARSDSLKAAGALLNAGSDASIENQGGHTPLAVAIRQDAGATALLLAQQAVSLHHFDIESSLVGMALRANRLEIASTLVGLDPSPSRTDGGANLLGHLEPEISQWLVALSAVVLANAEGDSSTEVMPVLAIEDFELAAAVIGIVTTPGKECMELFLEAMRRQCSRRYDAIHSSGEVFGAPLSLLLCASSIAVASTMLNTTFHELHPKIRSVLGSNYEDGQLGRAWRNLRSWFAARGTKLAWPEESWLVNVGPALYHTIWRPSDREDLFEALESIGADPGRSWGPQELGILLDKRRNGFSVHIQKMLAADNYRDAVVRSAISNLRAKRHTIERSAIKKSRVPWAKLSLQNNPRTGTVAICCILPRAEGMPEQILFRGTEIVSEGDFYQPINLSSSISNSGSVSTLSETKFRIPDLAIPLIFSVRAGNGREYTLPVGEPRTIVCPRSCAAEITEFLATIHCSAVRQRGVDGFPELVALGPLSALHPGEGPFDLVASLIMDVELLGGMRFKNGSYHRLAPPSVLLPTGCDESELEWLVDETRYPANIVLDELGTTICAAPEGGTTYILFRGNQRLTGFRCSDSVFSPRSQDTRFRWPVLLPRSSEFVVIGSEANAVARLRIGKVGVPTVPFSPCWAISDKAVPLQANIPMPEQGEPVGDWREATRRNVLARAGDYLSKSLAERCWSHYVAKGAESIVS